MAGQTSADSKAPPEEELLCTICGLTACWKKPAETPGAAATKEPAEGAPTPG